MDKSDRNSSSSEDPYHGVPKADVEAWAERERDRRRKWLEGPTEEEKREWAVRQARRRRLDDDFEEGRRVADDAAMALAGAANRLAEAPYRILGDLVRAGRDAGTKSRRRGRVHYRDED